MNDDQHQEHVLRQRARVVTICEDMLTGATSIIFGSRQLTWLRFEVGLRDVERDSDFETFVAIDSETDDLPVGQERANWAEYALARKDEEIRRAELLYKEVAFSACRSLVARYKRP
jgi:hypothetical protein